MRFIYNLLRAYRIATQDLKYAEVYDLKGSWDEGNRVDTANFFSTATGRILKQRLLNMVIKSQAAACDPAGGYSAEFRTGIARGTALAINAMQEHFLIRAPSA